MSKYLDPSASEPMTDSYTPMCELDCEADSELPSEFGANSHSDLWIPEQPQYCKGIADYYGVSRKSVQLWYQKVASACPWLSNDELKLPDGRYTPLCIELMGDYRLSGLSFDAWKSSIWERYPEAVQAFLAFQNHPSQEHFSAPDPHQSPESGNLIPYCPTTAEMQQFTPPARKLFKYTSTEAFVDQAKQQTEEGLDTTQSNSIHLVDALISQMKQEGQKLGVTLFQAKYGTAHAVMAELEQALAKKSGLVETEEPPPSPSPSV